MHFDGLFLFYDFFLKNSFLWFLFLFFCFFVLKIFMGVLSNFEIFVDFLNDVFLNHMFHGR